MATIQKVSGIDFANISKFDGVDISAVGSINLIGKPIKGSLLLDQSYGSGAEAAYSVRSCALRIQERRCRYRLHLEALRRR